MTTSEAKTLTCEEYEALESQLIKAQAKWTRKADKMADSNDEIEGQHWEDWAIEQATIEVWGSLEAYSTACGC
jgi:hypothetical protein